MLHLRSGPTYKNMRIGLLGGSFNPAHSGHLDLSLHALKALQLDQIWWLVSPQNPLKPTKGMAALEKRLLDARALVVHPKIIISGIETELGTRYTAHTLRELKRRFKGTRFVWLMGEDNLRQVHRWRDWRTVFRLVPVAVFRRPAYAGGRGLGKASQRFPHFRLSANGGKKLVGQKTPLWFVAQNRLNSLSATAIRKDRRQWQEK